MLSPLHAVLDERVMEIALVNYNLVNTSNLSLRTFTAGKDPRQEYTILSKDGQKQADFEDHAQITHPTQGLDLEKLSQGMAKFHFSNIPNTGRR